MNNGKSLSLSFARPAVHSADPLSDIRGSSRSSDRMILTSLVHLIVRRTHCSPAGQLTRAMAAKLVRHKLPPDSQAYHKFVDIRDSPEVKLLVDIFKSAGFELRIAGGAVRDLLTGVTPHDVDFATTALPDKMIEILRSVCLFRFL